MSQLQQLTRTECSLTLTGRRFRLTLPTLADLAQIECQAIEQHPGALTTSRMAAWIESLPGTAFVIWLALRTHQPEVSPQRVRADVERAIAAAENIDDAGRHRDDVIAREPSPGDVALDWAGLFDRFARRYGWTPSQVAHLTLAQADALIARPAIRRVLVSRRAHRRWQAGRQPFGAVSGASEQSPKQSNRCDARLAAFRDQLPEVFVPLTSAAVGRLAGASSWRGHGLPRSPRTRRRRSNSVFQRVTRAHSSAGEVRRQVARQLETLVEALRAVTSHGESPIVPGRRDERCARFL